MTQRDQTTLMRYLKKSIEACPIAVDAKLTLQQCDNHPCDHWQIIIAPVTRRKKNRGR